MRLRRLSKRLARRQRSTSRRTSDLGALVETPATVPGLSSAVHQSEYWHRVVVRALAQPTGNC